MKKLKKLTVIISAFLLAASVFAFSGCAQNNGSLTIAVPNDPTNEARALMLLQDRGYIQLKDGADITATVNDIAENPHNIVFREMEAAQLPNALKDVDYAIINSN